jgi:hypothetical protein
MRIKHHGVVERKTFLTVEAAALAYDALARQYFGTKAKLSFPNMQQTAAPHDDGEE